MVLYSQMVLKVREGAAQPRQFFDYLGLDIPGPKPGYQNSPTFSPPHDLSTIPIPTFQVSTCQGTAELIITASKHGRCSHTLKAIPGCLL